MTTSFSVRCACGAVRGHAADLSPLTTMHIVCYCDDCRAFARFLEREDVLGPHGGSAIVQMAPSSLRIEHGHDRIRAMRLSPSGMVRFYSSCCRTPLGNTMGIARVPFVGVSTSFIDVTPTELVDALGEAVGVQSRFAKDGVPPNAHPSMPFGLMRRSLAFLFRGFLRGAHAPSPLYDLETGRPVAKPSILSIEEREALRARD